MKFRKRSGNRVVWRNRRAGDGSAGVLRSDSDRMIHKAAMKYYAGLYPSLKQTSIVDETPK